MKSVLMHNHPTPMQLHWGSVSSHSCWSLLPPSHPSAGCQSPALAGWFGQVLFCFFLLLSDMPGWGGGRSIPTSYHRSWGPILNGGELLQAQDGIGGLRDAVVRGKQLHGQRDSVDATAGDGSAGAAGSPGTGRLLKPSWLGREQTRSISSGSARSPAGAPTPWLWGAAQGLVVLALRRHYFLAIHYFKRVKHSRTHCLQPAENHPPGIAATRAKLVY